jgi:hypothetical protein
MVMFLRAARNAACRSPGRCLWPSPPCSPYPLIVAFALRFNGAATLLQNHRGDLTANAIMEIVFAIALAVWIVAFPNQRYAIAQSTISCAEKPQQSPR